MRRAAGMHECEPVSVPERLEWRECGVKGEEAVEIDRGLGLSGRRWGDPDATPGRVIGGVTVRDHHTEPIHRPPLEDGDQDLTAPVRRAGLGRAHEEARNARGPRRETAE